MNIHEKREAIRLRVIEKIPEIAELKFGCVVEMEENTSLRRVIKGWIISRSQPYEGGRTYTWNVQPFHKNKIENFGETYGESPYTNKARIIGRPIISMDITRSLGGEAFLHGNGLFGTIRTRSRCFLLDQSQNLESWSDSVIEELYPFFYE